MGCDFGCEVVSPLFGAKFQSTHPHGVRRCNLLSILLIIVMFQSTHPHGVRLTYGYLPRYAELFQSTHPHGVRRPSMADKSTQGMFQSTHPHGVRQTRSEELVGMGCFNPRTHMGCDSISPSPVRSQSPVSIHAPTWGATTDKVATPP